MEYLVDTIRALNQHFTNLENLCGKFVISVKLDKYLWKRYLLYLYTKTFVRQTDILEIKNKIFRNSSYDEKQSLKCL